MAAARTNTSSYNIDDDDIILALEMEARAKKTNLKNFFEQKLTEIGKKSKYYTKTK